MKYKLMIRARPNEDMFEKHDRFMRFLATLGRDWALGGKEWPAVKDPKTEFHSEVSLTNYLGRGIRASLLYQNRKYLRDEGKFDDHFTMTFNPTKVDYTALVTEILERLIDAFGAYLAELGDEEFVHLDFERARKVQSRRAVFRVYPVGFWDRELSRRAFGLTPEDIAARLGPHVEQARVASGGVLVIATSKIISLDEANAINDRLKPLLN